MDSYPYFSRTRVRAAGRTNKEGRVFTLPSLFVICQKLLFERSLATEETQAGQSDAQ
jgi:hypothetical protein